MTRPLRAAALLLVAALATACTGELPILPDPGPAAVKPLLRYSSEYYCELGVAGYEGACETFGGNTPCTYEAHFNNWGALMANPKCGMPTAYALSVQFANDVRIELDRLLGEALADRPFCGTLKSNASRVMLGLQVRVLAADLPTANAVQAYWPGAPTDHVMIAINPSRVALGVTATAQTILHELLHPLMGLVGDGTGGSDKDIVNGSTAGSQITAVRENCTTA